MIYCKRIKTLVWYSNLSAVGGKVASIIMCSIDPFLIWLKLSPYKSGRGGGSWYVSRQGCADYLWVENFKIPYFFGVRDYMIYFWESKLFALFFG